MANPSSIIPGAEPQSFAGNKTGVLVLHGFTGNPQSMRPLAQAFADAGFSVELPLLPGHGTTVEDMIPTRWSDWATAAAAAYEDLAARCDKVFVAGLSMGGTLTLSLAQRYPEIAGIMLVNPAAPEPGSSAELIEGLKALAESGVPTMDAIGGDIADPDATELAYDKVPIEALMSLWSAAEEVAGRLPEITMPAILFSSREDHVVPPAHGEFITKSLGDNLTVVTLERSYHVATLDYDKELIATQAVQFVQQIINA